MAFGALSKQAPLSLVELKRLAREQLPRGSTFRKILETEPDVLPHEQGLARLELYVKLFHQEKEQQ